MLCQICKKNEATIIIVKVVGKNKTEFNVCSECANYLLADTVSSISFSQYNINNILDSLLSTFEKYANQEMADTYQNELHCSNCGMSYNEFIQTGKVGCSQCYEYFRNNLKPLLGKLHGYSQHTGKFPLSVKERFTRLKKIKEIKNELQQAVLKEEYEKAATLRDMIIEEEKRLENENNE
ncbi:MAG: UvrB/UvrC motif-containing protein [Candidatus Atribacteria bacterium]|nr:UvrB/UvrC motif-containing protein [Candidatus Atribacteria bacterium]